MYLLHTNEYVDPFYQTAVHVFPWESELIRTRTVRRLKFLSHYGTGSLITSAKHSRFEHTLGVWTLIATFFPQDEELRIAALLHDIGHLPFSHAVEHTLGFEHHHLTEDRIRSEEIAGILLAHGYEPERIIRILNGDSPLTHKTPYLSADHLDSFLRDSYMLGMSSLHPASMVKRIGFHHHYVEAADSETGKALMNALYDDHSTFLHPQLLALDAVLSKAIKRYAEAQTVDLSFITSLTNQELLQLLAQAEVEEVSRLLDIILWDPERILVHDQEVPNAERVEVRKVYDKTPLLNGSPLVAQCPESRDLLERIRAMKRSHYFTIRPTP